MTLTVYIHESWLERPAALAEFLGRVRALERSAAAILAPTPPPAREPGDDDGDDLGELLSGMSDPEPAPPPAAPAPAPAPKPAAPFNGMPRSGRELYKIACDRKALPIVNRIGKAHGWPRLVTDWTPEQAAIGYRELTGTPEPAANGRPH
jgi:hypothetical protein